MLRLCWNLGVKLSRQQRLLRHLLFSALAPSDLDHKQCRYRYETSPHVLGIQQFRLQIFECKDAEADRPSAEADGLRQSQLFSSRAGQIGPQQGSISNAQTSPQRLRQSNSRIRTRRALMSPVRMGLFMFCSTGFNLTY